MFIYQANDVIPRSKISKKPQVKKFVWYIILSWFAECQTYYKKYQCFKVVDTRIKLQSHTMKTLQQSKKRDCLFH